MATFNCKFAIFESQQGVMLLELMTVLLIVALLATYWARFYVQLRLEERRVVVQLEALHMAASYLDRLHAQQRVPRDEQRVIKEYCLLCTMKILDQSGLWMAEVVVSHAILNKGVILRTCGHAKG